MALDPNIILRGQPVNILASMGQGMQVGAAQRGLAREADLQNIYARQGAGILAGDQGAINALAGHDPMAALNVQNTQLDMDATRQNMRMSEERLQMARDEAARSAAAQAAALDLATLEQERADAERVVTALNASSSPEQWDRMAQELGAPELAGRWADRQVLLAQAQGSLDGINQASGFRAATPEEAAQYGAQAGQFDIATGRFYPITPPSNMRLEVGADGSVALTEGNAPASTRPPTVDQAKNAGFLDRALQSNALLEGNDEQGTSSRGRILESLPFGVGNFAQTEDYQKFEQARRDFVNAILRRESGAVISPSEFANAERQYFPVPGDGDAVIEQKRQNRLSAIRGLEVGAGAALAGQVQRPEQAQVDQTNPYAGASFDEIQADLPNMTPEQRAQAIARLQEIANGG